MNTEKSPDPDHSDELFKKIEGLSASIEFTEKRINDIKSSQDTFLKCLTLLLGVVGLAGGIWVYNQGVSATETRAEIREALAQTKPSSVEKIFIRGPRDTTDSISATAAISYAKDDTISSYEFEVNFDLKLMFEGKGTNTITGFWVKIDQKLYNNILPYGAIYPENYLNGIAISIDPVDMVPGYYYPLSFNVGSPSLSCETVEVLEHQLENLNEIGTIEIEPLFELPANFSSAQTFKVTMRKQSKLWNCKDLEKANVTGR